MNAIPMSGDFTPEQKRYLEGFASGLQAGRACAARQSRGRRAPARAAEPIGPDAAASQGAGSRRSAGGKKLSDQEKFKRELHPFDGYERLKAQAAEQRGAEARRTISAGAFSACSTSRPTQNSYMCRLRMPNGILKHWQFAGLADLAEHFGGGYCPRHDARQSADPRDRAAATRSPWWRRSRTSACARAAPAPTTSATSPARRRPASIRRS